MTDKSTKARRRALAALAAAAMLPALHATPAAAQETFPSRPIRMLVGFAPGGGADAIARTIAQRLGEQLGQNVVVENRPGASSTIAADVLAKSANDGYTLMLADSSLLIAAQAMSKVSFDPLKSFDPVASVAIAPLAIAVNPNGPIKSLEDMAAIAKKGEPLIYATSGVGTVHHLAMEYLQSQANLKMTHVPYRGASLILPDLVSGQIPVAVLSAAAAIGQVKSEKIRVIGLTSPAKLPEADWRPVADWLPGFDASPRLFLIAPAGTPAAALRRLESETRDALANPAVRETLLKQGAVPASSTSAELGKMLGEEHQRWEKLIKQADIRLQ